MLPLNAFFIVFLEAFVLQLVISLLSEFFVLLLSHVSEFLLFRVDPNSSRKLFLNCFLDSLFAILNFFDLPLFSSLLFLQFLVFKKLSSDFFLFLKIYLVFVIILRIWEVIEFLTLMTIVTLMRGEYFNLVHTLLILEILVIVDDFLHDFNVWTNSGILLYQSLLHISDILPILDLLEKTQISLDDGGRSCDAALAVDKHFLMLVIDHVVEILGSLEYSIGVH